MHVFLFVCVLIEAVAIAVLSLKRGRTAHWADDVLDLAEESEKFKSELAALADAVSLLSKERIEDTRDTSQRITELSDKIEAMRRKSSSRMVGGGFESIRSRAEAAASKAQQMPREKLLSLAEGS